MDGWTVCVSDRKKDEQWEEKLCAFMSVCVCAFMSVCACVCEKTKGVDAEALEECLNQTF